MAAMMPVPDTNNHNSDSPNYKQKYRTLKRKLKFLLYEQEYFQEELRKVQKKLLRVSRDKSFLLDRLLQYEAVEHSSSDEDSTASSSNSDTEGQKMIMTETTYSNSRSKKPQAATLHNHTMHSEGFGLFPYASPSGSAESGGNTGPEPGSNLVQCKFSSNMRIGSKGREVGRERTASTEGAPSEKKITIRAFGSISNILEQELISGAKQCQELVSKRSKSGYCNSHRTMVRISKQSMSLTPKISQPHIADEVSRQDELVVDQQLERLQELAEPAMVQRVSQASEQVPQEMFSVDEDDRESENEDSPASAGFHGNVYEGDDDLVIDLPE